MLRDSRILSPAVLLIFFGTLACGSTTEPERTYSMTGWVRCSVDSAVPVAGARATLLRDGRQTIAGEHGQFRFHDLDPDLRYSVLLEHRDYETLQAAFRVHSTASCPPGSEWHECKWDPNFFDFYMNPISGTCTAAEAGGRPGIQGSGSTR